MRDFRVANGATEILLIRHAEAESLPANEVLEPKDVDMPLTARGRSQAEAVALRLQRREIATVYHSGLRRAFQTAVAIAEKANVLLQEDDRLREVEIAGVGPVAMHDLAEIALAHGGWSHLQGTES